MASLSFTRNKLWKYIGCIISSFTYGINGDQIWGKLKHQSVRRGKLHNTEMLVGINIY